MKNIKNCFLVNRCVLYKCSFIVAVFLFLGVILLSPVTLLAMNEDYLYESKWSESENTNTILINKKSMGNTLDGVFKYYIDNNNVDMYLYFYITESTLNTNSNDVKININVRSDIESYTFSIDKNGMCDALDEEAKLFSVQQNFSYKADSDSGLYIAGIHADSREQLTCNIKLYVNGHIYKIIDSIILAPSVTTTTARSVKTTSAKSSSAKSGSTAGASSAKSSAGSATAAGTTKFNGTPVAPNPTAQKQASSSAEYSNSIAESVDDSVTVEYDSVETTATVNSQKTNVTLSRTAKIGIYVGIAVAVIGLILLIIAVTAHRNEKNDTKSADEE